MEVDPSALLRRRFALRLLVRLLPRLDRAQLEPRPVEQRLSGQVEIRNPPDEHLLLLVFKLVDFQRPLRRRRAGNPVPTERPFHGERAEHGAALDSCDLTVPAFRDGKRNDAVLDAVEIHLERRRLFLCFLLLVGRRLPDLRHERRTEVLAQGHKRRAHPARESQIEMHVVVDGIKLAIRKKVEILPLRIERRRHVAQHRPRDRTLLPGGDLTEPQDAQVRGFLKTVRQPPAVRRPSQTRDPPVAAAVEHPHFLPRKVDQNQLVPVVGQSNLVLLWRHLQLDRPARVEAREPHRLFASVGVEDHQGFLSALIGHRDEPLAVRQPVGEAVSNTVPRTVLVDRPLPVRHRENAAARGERDGVPLRMRRVVFEVPRRVHVFAVALRPRTAEVNVDLPRPPASGIEQKQVGPRVVDDPAAVGGGIPQVVVLVIRMPPQSLPLGRAGIQVADALVVRMKVNPIADPCGARGISPRFDQPLEAAAPVPVHPELPDRPAPVPLP